MMMRVMTLILAISTIVLAQTENEGAILSVREGTSLSIVENLTSTLKALSPGATIEAWNAISAQVEEAKKHPAWEERPWDLRWEAFQKAAFSTPKQTMALTWPLFALFVVFWFIKQLRKVFFTDVVFSGEGA